MSGGCKCRPISVNLKIEAIWLFLYVTVLGHYTYFTLCFAGGGVYSQNMPLVTALVTTAQ